MNIPSLVLGQEQGGAWKTTISESMLLWDQG
jgi:hypothetical protein